MGYLVDFTVGSIIGFILYILVISVSRSATSDLEFNEKTQKIFIINFITGLCLLCLAYTTFSKGGKLYNRSMKTGLLISGFCLSLNTIIINWDFLSDNTRIFLIGLSLAIVIWYAYYLESDTPKKKKKKRIKENSEQ